MVPASLLVAAPRLAALGLVASFPGLALLASGPARAAEQLEVRLDQLRLPLDLRDLEQWSREPERPPGDLAVWVDLIEPSSRRDLLRLLRAPLVRDRSLGQQLLQSWAGQRVLDEVGDLIDAGQPGKTGPLLLGAMQRLLERQSHVTTIELLRAVPVQQLSLDLDGLLELAAGWRHQIQRQRRGLGALRRLELPERGPLLPLTDGADLRPDPAPSRPRGRAKGAPALAPRSIELTVAHRPAPLRLQLWQPRRLATPPGPWVLLMPGLGGSPAQLEWLAGALAQRGWPVLVLDHPDSGEAALRDLLDGRGAPPGAETLPDRLRDIQAVVAAEHDGRLPPLGESVVLMGHSLGGLATLLAAGLRPEPGLARRCERALDGIPLTNLSRLLQCQLTQVALPPPSPLDEPLAGVVSFNGFGSLLWPHRGLGRLGVPALLVGGSLDLVTPPLSEQLELFLPAARPMDRLALVEGGSHFSPVRIRGGDQALFRLGDGLVGLQPERVQALLLSLSSEFLQGLPQGRAIPVQRRQLDGVTAYVLDREAARRWWDGVRP